MGACTLAAAGTQARQPFAAAEPSPQGPRIRASVTMSNSYATPGDTCDVSSRGLGSGTVRGIVVSQSGAAAAGRLFRVVAAAAASVRIECREQDAGGPLGEVADATDLSTAVIVIDFFGDV